MTISLALSLLVMILGAAMYWWASNPKLQEIGRIAFAFGLLVSLLRLGGGLVVSLFRQ